MGGHAAGATTGVAATGVDIGRRGGGQFTQDLAGPGGPEEGRREQRAASSHVEEEEPARHDRRADRTLVEAGRAVAADPAQRARQVLLHQRLAHLERLAVVQEDGGGGRVLAEVLGGHAQHVHVALLELEALFGQRDGRLEQAGPRQAAMLAMRQLQHAHGTGHAHRTAADRGVPRRSGGRRRR